MSALESSSLAGSAPSEQELLETLAEAIGEFERLASEEPAKFRPANLLTAHQLRWLASALPGLLATARDGDGAREVLYGPSVQRGADRLAGEVCWLVDRGRLDARSPAGDALLDYAAAKYGDHDPLGAVRKRYEEIQVKLAAARSTGSVDNG